MAAPTEEKTELSYAEKMRRELIEKHGQPLSEDDPILMLATMFENFMRQYDSTLDRHKNAIEKFMRDVSQHYADKVQQSTDNLLERAVQGSIQNNIKTMGEFKNSLEQFARTNRIYATVSAGSCIVSICLFLTWLFLRGT